MNLPVPPTDNLYKFCALAGVVMTLVAIYVPHILTSDLNDKIARGRLGSAQVGIELKYINRELDRLKAIVDLEQLDGKARTSALEGKIAVATTPEQVREAWIAVLSQSKAQELKHAESESLVVETGRLLKELQIIIIASVVLFAAGLSLASYGFTCWFRRVQKHQDALLAAEAAATSAVTAAPALQG